MNQKRRSFILLFACLSFYADAQVALTELYEPRFSHDIEKGLQDGSLRSTSAAYYYTFIGEYEKALSNYELALEWGLDTMTTADRLRFEAFKPVDAFTYLDQHLRGEQIVIISEAHQKPQHRVFTNRLLPILQKHGFRYLGIETLGPNRNGTDPEFFLSDTLLNQRGYPLYMPLTGTYTLEPQMGNVIRTANDLGFSVFAYERTSRENDRDLQQALNIKAFLDQHPGAKIVIHCGWYHAIESEFAKQGQDHWMAYHLKQLTGIDPLTIYQDALTEKRTGRESPYFQMIDSDQISILVDKSGNVFNGVDRLDHFDMLLYHPRTTYIKGRPDWLLAQDGAKRVKIRKQKIKTAQYPLLVKAYLSEETAQATPVDIIELNDPSQAAFLILQRGATYRISMVDKERREFHYRQRVK